MIELLKMHAKSMMTKINYWFHRIYQLIEFGLFFVFLIINSNCN